MLIKISAKKSVQENANDFFDKAKKAKKKITGVQSIIEVYEKKLQALEKKVATELFKAKEQSKPKEMIVRKWYEKFHWFFSSENFLVIGGRDSGTNETVIKKCTDPTDIVLHTELPGSPFCVIKSEGKKIGEQTIQEAGIFCAIYSRMWKLNILGDVFYVTPEQVSKQAKAGEFIQKGAFMIYGKKNFVKNIQLEMAIGIEGDHLIGGPISAVKSHTENFVIIQDGDKKPSDLAKLIHKKLGTGDLDEIIRFLPSGNGKIVENIKRDEKGRREK